MTRNLRWLVTGVLLGALGVAGIVGCAQRETAPPGERSITRVPEPEDVVDEELMLALATAKNYHHKAKVYMSDGNLAEATAQIEAVLAVPFPAGAPEGDDVRLDARAMLGKLLVAQGKVDEAMSVVDQGIGGARRDSFFLANLYTVKGEVHQARAGLLEGESPSEPVKARIVAEKRAAIDAFDRSIAIDNMLQKKLVEDRAKQRREGGE
jgi:hypothetical protein